MKKLIITVLLICALATSCEKNIDSLQNSTVSSQITESQPNEITEQISDVTTAETTETVFHDTIPENTEIISQTDKQSDTSEIYESETSTEKVETTTVTEAPTVTPASIEITTTAKAVTPQKPFDIRIPTASGEKAISENSGVIDYSNADDGYIAASYSGSSAAAKLRVICGNTQYDHDLSADGSTVFFPLMGSGSYTVRIYEQVSGKSYSLAAEASFEANIKSETDMYLYPNKYSYFDKSSDCVKKAYELCCDKPGTIEKIAAIFTFISDNISYDKDLAARVTNGLTGYTPDPDRTLKSGKGICFDYSSLMTAMCRSQGIPSRLVIGYAKENIYHAWNEIYTEETGWITPELFLKNKGYNIADATFYSSQKDKKKIGEYISESKNYSALYRY